MIRWNNKFPVDFWWRQKHKVPFLSKCHREQSFLNQLMEYQEELLFQERDKPQNDINSPENYIPNIGDFIKIPLIKEEYKEGELNMNELEEFRRIAQEMEESENGSREEDTNIN